MAGVIRNPFTLPGWDDAPIVAAMEREFGLQTLLENDVDAALTGEFLFGAAEGRDPAAMLTFGTGVGGAVLIGGKILRGVGGAHPEPGHMQVLPDGPECYCGNRGCLESIASGTALAESGLRAGFADAPSLFAAARAGDSSADSILQRAALAIASAVWNIAHAYAPQVIVLGGGIMEEHFDLLTADLKPLWERATQIPCSSISIVKAALGNRAGIVGAAGVVFRLR
jgi:glucokinase